MEQAGAGVLVRRYKGLARKGACGRGISHKGPIPSALSRPGGLNPMSKADPTDLRAVLPGKSGVLPHEVNYLPVERFSGADEARIAAMSGRLLGASATPAQQRAAARERCRDAADSLKAAQDALEVAQDEVRDALAAYDALEDGSYG